jgi:hypothetical protein
MGVRLYGVTSHDGHVLDELPGEGSLLQVRDLAAVIGPAPYQGGAPDDEAIDLHRRMIDVVFRHRTVLPLPVGTVFRGTHALERWMELHYVSLSDALAYVDDRVAARVRVSRLEMGVVTDDGPDLASSGAEVMRALRRRAVASVPLRGERVTGLSIASAFLVERELWREFTKGVEEVQASDSQLRVESSGPWPPYDFVRIELGG